MTNAEKYKTAEERVEAFRKFCDATKLKKQCEDALSCTECQFAWLDMEAEEERPLPCPFCGGGADVISTSDINLVSCAEGCGYYSQRCESAESAIAAHNRVARAVMDAKESEEK